MKKAQLLVTLAAGLVALVLLVPTSAQVGPGPSGPPIRIMPMLPTLVGGPIIGTTGTFSGAITSTSDVTARDLVAGAARFIYWNGRSLFSATADKLVQVENNAATTGMELNVGTPTLGVCTAGALTSGSHNFAGEYTGNTSSSCIINFGAPNFTNTPFCFAMSETSTTHPRISASAASSITVTGGVSGEAIQYFCVGRIGT